MRFGHFDDQNKEYVITTPQTPLPWINYLGSEDFFSLVSNTAGGDGYAAFFCQIFQRWHRLASFPGKDSWNRFL